MLFILLARWIIKTRSTIIEDNFCFICKRDNNQGAWIACHLIFSGFIKFEQKIFIVVMMSRRRKLSHGGGNGNPTIAFLLSNHDNHQTIVCLRCSTIGLSMYVVLENIAWCSDADPVQTQVNAKVTPHATPQQYCFCFSVKCQNDWNKYLIN